MLKSKSVARRDPAAITSVVSETRSGAETGTKRRIETELSETRIATVTENESETPIDPESTKPSRRSRK
jgi:hypothetical protein